MISEAQRRVLRKLEEGEIRDERPLPAAEKLFGVSHNTVNTLITEGLVKTDREKTATYGYKITAKGRRMLLDDASSVETVNVKKTIRKRMSEDSRIQEALNVLFPDGGVPVRNMVVWLDLTREMIRG